MFVITENIMKRPVCFWGG